MVFVETMAWVARVLKKHISTGNFRKLVIFIISRTVVLGGLDGFKVSHHPI